MSTFLEQRPSKHPQNVVHWSSPPHGCSKCLPDLWNSFIKIVLSILLSLEPKKDFKQIRCVWLQNSGLLQYSNTTYLVFTEKKTRLISWYFFGESTRRTRVEPGHSFFLESRKITFVFIPTNNSVYWCLKKIFGVHCLLSRSLRPVPSLKKTPPPQHLSIESSTTREHNLPDVDDANVW